MRIRLLGPWFGRGFGDVSNLKPAQRWELGQYGYTIVAGRFTAGEECVEWLGTQE